MTRPITGNSKYKVGGSFVANTPRYINLGSGLVVTEDELNDRLDIVVQVFRSWSNYKFHDSSRSRNRLV